MQSAECSVAGMGPHMTITGDGRLWVTTLQGLAMIDLPHLPRNAGKPVVYVQDTVVGRKSQRPGDRLVLPPGTSHLELAFDAIELSAPQRIRLQYRLDGVDDSWLDAPPSHVATYSGMSPGLHTFHVRATNRDGVWDLVGMTYQVTQEPFVYQTAWFQALGVAAFLGMLGGLYWYRMRRLAHEFNVRLEERVTERTRIARELHDTLLQRFQGVLLNFHAVTYLFPDRPEARRAIEVVVDEARDAITEGRNAVEGLRSAKHDCSNLEAAISSFGQELAGQPHSPELRVNLQGIANSLAPLVANEVYHIATEALRNAFQHAQARRIEVEIRYHPREFRLRVRDNGTGIEPHILQDGRAGHFGIPGMRERARLVGGKLIFWSKPDSGTEIELTVPASLAYAKELESPTLAGKIRRMLS
jgi:signal transduction histidine kinase